MSSFLKKRSRVRPLFKQFVKLRENVLDRFKLFKFKRQKWEKLQSHYERKFRWYNRYKAQDLTRFEARRFPSRGTSISKVYRDALHVSRKIRLVYGNLTKKQEKKYLNQKNRSLQILDVYESRLDAVLYRSKFCRSVRSARQLIANGVALVNKKKVSSPSYELKKGDLISITKSYKHIINKNCSKMPSWPVPQKTSFINYKTQEIVFLGPTTKDYIFSFNYYLNIERAVNDSFYQ